MEEVLKRRSLHKITIGVLKVIPMLLALISLLNSTLSYFNIDIELFSYVGCASFLSISFIYLASYCFGFCAYHRMFLNYVVVNDLLSIYDYYIGIPVSDIGMFLIHIMITGIFLYIILYLHQKCKNDKNTTKTLKKDR